MPDLRPQQTPRYHLLKRFIGHHLENGRENQPGKWFEGIFNWFSHNGGVPGCQAQQAMVLRTKGFVGSLARQRCRCLSPRHTNKPFVSFNSNVPLDFKLQINTVEISITVS